MHGLGRPRRAAAIGQTGSKQQGSNTWLAFPAGSSITSTRRQAVEDGLGIGIGPLPMLEIDVANGRLMTPLPEIRVPRTGYVAVTPRHADAGNLIASFVDWLVAAGSDPTGTISAPEKVHT